MKKEKENYYIITPRSKRLRGVIYNVLGGLTIIDIFVLAAAIIIGAVLLATTGLINIWLGVFCLVFMVLVGITLVVPVAQKDKVYQLLFKQFIYLFKGRNRSKQEIKATDPLDKLTNKGIELINKTVVKYYHIKSNDVSLLQPQEKSLVFSKLDLILRNCTLAMDIFSLEQPRNLLKHLEHLATLMEDNQKEDPFSYKKAVQLNNLADLYEEVINNEAYYEKTWILAVYGPNFSTIDRTMAVLLDKYDADLNFRALEKQELKIIAQHLRYPNQVVFEAKTLENIKEHTRYLKFSEDSFMAFRSIFTFPLLVGDQWLYNLANIPHINMMLKINYLNDIEAVKRLDKAIGKASGYDSRKASDQIGADFYERNFSLLLEQVKTKGECLKLVQVIFILHGTSLEDLRKQEKVLITEMAKNGFLYDALKYEQLSVYQYLAKAMPLKHALACQEISVTTLSASWPFNPVALDDQKGLLLGYNDFNEPVFFDIKTRDAKGRVSSNALVLGMTGFGKTYNVSKQINWLILNNTKIFIIDPEREYHRLCRYYNGHIIAIGKHEKARLNPLEVFGADLMEHIIFLEEFFKIIYPTLNTHDFANWQKILLLCYQNHKITKTTDFSKLKAKDYPTMQDLYATSQAFDQKKANLNSVSHILWKLAHGGDGYLWNSHSTLEIKDTAITVYDIHELTNNSNIRNAQIFLMLAFIDREIKRNKAKNYHLPQEQQAWIAVVLDEAHLLVNERSALALNFLFEMTKRIRKYNGIIYMISQNVNDFVGSSAIRTQTEGIINNCGYWFIHHLAPKDLRNLDDLLSSAGRLNEYQKNQVTYAEQGTCLFINNNQRSMLHISSSSEEEQAWL